MKKGEELQSEELVYRLLRLEQANYLQMLKADDTYCLTLLQSLINGYSFLPFTGSSMRPYGIALILNDIMVNSRKNIIEFGSGISTVVIGRLLKRNNINGRLVTVEHDEKWVETLKGILKSEDLDDVIKVVHAPLKDCSLAIDANKWYDTKVLIDEINEEAFDLVIIDGPPAWEQGKEHARFPALPFISNYLSPQFSVYLDDVNRKGEQAVLSLWMKKYDIKFSIKGYTLALASRGQLLYTEPFIYF